MSDLYQRTFDHVQLSEERTQSLRGALMSRRVNTEREVNTMKERKIFRRSTSFLVAAALAAAVSVSALACGVYCYVTYRINDGAQSPDHAVALTDEAEFETGNYAYREENGKITVDLTGDARD